MPLYCRLGLISMTVRILLVRHAAHDLLGRVLCGRQDGVGLNAAGFAQSLLLGKMLRRENIATIYASPRLRTRQTADTIAENSGLETKIADALDELDFGDWTGLSFEELACDKTWNRWNTDRSQHCAPRGESMLEVQVRLAGWFRQMVAAHEGQTIAAVSHADVIKAACCHVLGLSIDAYQRFDIDPASITTLLAGDWGMRLLRMNQV
jgi:broad specificity phosphatase PhoE